MGWEDSVFLDCLVARCVLVHLGLRDPTLDCGRAISDDASSGSHRMEENDLNRTEQHAGSDGVPKAPDNTLGLQAVCSHLRDDNARWRGSGCSANNSGGGF
jgi:hypothetical protein